MYRFHIVVIILFVTHLTLGQPESALKLDEAETWINLGDFDIMGEEITIEALIYMETKESVEEIDGVTTYFSPTIVTKHDGPGDLNYLFRPNLFAVSTTDGFVLALNSMYGVMVLEKWYHVAGVYDGSYIYFYLNGCLVGKSPATGILNQNNYDTAIGNGAEYISSSQFQDQFFGKLAEVRFWNVARTAEEIQNNMFGVDPSSTGLLAYYNFESTDGTTVSIEDISPNNRHGTWGIDADGVTINEGERSDFPSSAEIPTNNIADLLENEIVNESDYVWSGSSTENFTTLENWLILENGSLTPATSGYTANSNIIIPSEGGCTFERSVIPESSTIAIHDLHITTDAILELENNTSVNLDGDYLNHGSIVSSSLNEQLEGSRTIRFIGENDQQINSGGTLNTSDNRKLLHHIEIDKTGGNVIIVENDLEYSGVLIFEEGNLNLNGQRLIMASTASISGENNDRRIFGATGTVETTRTFGSALTNETFGSIGITVSTDAPLGETTITRSHSQQTALGNESIYRYFDIQPTTNTGLNATLRMDYFDNEVPGTHDEDNFKLYRSTDGGTTWFTQFESTVNTGSKYVEMTAIPSFSMWTISDDLAQPLPINFLGMEVACQRGNEVIINWSTASEINTHYFNIERSRDGKEWEIVGEVPAMGNTGTLTDYSFTDASVGPNFEGYYRLRKFDIDGQYEVFAPLSLFCNEEKTSRVEIYPNPSDGKAQVFIYAETEMEGQAELQLTDGVGKVVQRQDINIKPGAAMYPINIVDKQSGMYYLNITFINGQQLGAKLIKSQ